VAFNGDVMQNLATQFLELAEKQGATAPLMIGHRLAGTSLMSTGRIAEGRAHCNQALALYDPAAHRPLAARFGQDVKVSILSFRSLALVPLGYPEGALDDTEQAVRCAREIDQAATLMYALGIASTVHFLCGNYAAANAEATEVGALAGEKGASYWKAWAILVQGLLLDSTGDRSNAVRMITSGLTAFRSTGATQWASLFLPYLTRAYAELGQFEDAWRCMSEAMIAIETTKERLFEAEAYRMAGEVALLSSETTKADDYFDRALAVARKQQAKFWELRAAMSMARLWRNQGKRDEARELLAPIYGWFTEGFDTRDLKEAKALLDELAA
jgi:predicted ATPase